MIYYLIIINIVTFLFYGIDKSKAKNKQRRISEKTLLFLSFIGGCVGALIGMYIFHHKTKKMKFIILVPLSLLLWVYILFIKCN